MAADDEHIALLGEARRLSDLNDQQGAERCARRALTLRPSDPMTVAILALVLSRDAARGNEAAVLAARALELLPDEPKIHHLAVSIALRDRCLDLAQNLLNHAHIRWPSDRRVLHDMALVAQAQGNHAHVAALLDYERDIGLFGGLASQEVQEEIADAVIGAIAAGHGTRAATMSGGVRLDDAFQMARGVSASLYNILEAAVAQYRSAREPHPVGKARIIRAWANAMEEGDCERSHIHEQAWISGVYYPRAIVPPEGSDAGALLFGAHHFSATVPPLPEYKVIPRSGDVIMFPAHFPHATIPFEGSGFRISIAFDVAPPV